MTENVDETREITLNKGDSVRIRTMSFAISCILLVMSIPTLIVQTNKIPYVGSKPINEELGHDLLAQDNGSISEPTSDFGKRQRIDIPEIPAESPCQCRLPFYPAGNCTLCFYVPSYTENNFVRLKQYSKEAAKEKCVDELKGEIPSSEWFYKLPVIQPVLAKEQLVILQREISVEAALWFGATWDINKEEYLSDKGKSEIIQRTTNILILESQVFRWSYGIFIVKDGTIVTDLITQTNEKTTTYYLALVLTRDQVFHLFF